MFKYFSYLFLLFSFTATAQVHQDDILGRWISTNNDVAVNIYKVGKNFNAKIIWFDEKLGSGKPMNLRLDHKNPVAKLRERKIIGMDILDGLTFNSKGTWENGKIYDASSGRTWDASLELKENGQLFVRGYWKFKWIGKTIHFRRF